MEIPYKEKTMKKRFYLNIQLFAEGEETEETPTEQVENTEENDSENAEAENKEENKSEKGDEAEKKAKDEEIKKRKENSENAQRRIQERLERQERENQKNLEKEKRKSYIDGVKKSTNGVNKFTEKPIVDEDDVEEYELMLELERKGKDPIADYYEAVKEKTRAERQRKLEEEQAKSKAENDLNADVDAFVKKYGKETAQKISNDEAFMDFANDFLGRVPLTTVYEKYLAIQAKIEAKSDEKALEKDARRASSPGAPGKANETPKSFKDLTPEEFHKLSLEIAARR